MPRFFKDITPDNAVLDGADGAHIRRSLRMQVGEMLTVCNGKGTDYTCRIAAFDGDSVRLSIEATTPNKTEPTARVTLYMGLPKADKLEWVIQKAVELGVDTVVPVVTSRSIVKLDAASASKKQERWQRIAAEAAGQSERGVIPTVELPISFAVACKRMAAEKLLILYEGGGQTMETLLSPADKQVSLFVGPEGGISPEEVAAMQQAGGVCTTLGPRILRCETAPIAALAVTMHLTGNL